MASITYTKTAICQGGEHVTLTRSGAFNGSRTLEVSKIRSNPPSADELLAAEEVFLRLYANGKSLAQLNQAFTSGVTLTVE